MKKYQELENKVKELQAEIERLKKEEEKKAVKLPSKFSITAALEFLENPSLDNLDEAFVWASSAQGDTYWTKIYYALEKNSDYKPSDKAMMYMQQYVIAYFRRLHRS